MMSIMRGSMGLGPLGCTPRLLVAAEISDIKQTEMSAATNSLWGTTKGCWWQQKSLQCMGRLMYGMQAVELYPTGSWWQQASLFVKFRAHWLLGCTVARRRFPRISCFSSRFGLSDMYSSCTCTAFEWPLLCLNVLFMHSLLKTALAFGLEGCHVFMSPQVSSIVLPVLVFVPPVAAQEIAVMKKLDHPHVVKLHEVIDSPYAHDLMLVLEYCEGGPVLKMCGQSGFDRYGSSLVQFQ